MKNCRDKYLLEIICVTYGHNFELKYFINSIKAQSCKDWFLRIIHDGDCDNYKKLKKDLEENDYLVPNISIESTPKRFNDYGHSLRDYALKNPVIESEWTLITNGDNFYLPTFIDCVDFHSSKTPSLNIIHFNYITKYNYTEEERSTIKAECGRETKVYFKQMDSELEIGKIDMGSFVVKTDLARKVGFNSRKYEADWEYFVDCFDEGNKKPCDQFLGKVHEYLFVHV